MEKSVWLGSGTLYIAELEQGGTIPATLFSESNSVGDIKGGATLTYKPEITEIKNDFDEVKEAFIKAEDVTLKSGILTWDLSTIEKVAIGAKYDVSKKTLTIGGESSIKQYAIGFKHKKTGVEITLKGYNQSGFSMAFDPENPTIIDSEFKAIKQSDKTLVSIKEDTTQG